LRFNAGGSAPSFALGTSELWVQSALADVLAPGMTFYDVGANVGFYTILAALRVEGSGRVYSFEPVPSSAKAINYNLRLSGFEHVTVMPFAVSDRSGECRINVSRESFWSRLDWLPAPRGHDAVINAASITLDGLLASADCKPPDVVKIDVEGAELAVLDGMSRMLRSSRPVIICELHGTSVEVKRRLERAGYTVRLLEGPRTVRGVSRHVIATYGAR
jgi:FkbM family methyltransferase